MTGTPLEVCLSTVACKPDPLSAESVPAAMPFPAGQHMHVGFWKFALDHVTLYI